jgi:hypothetical protein
MMHATSLDFASIGGTLEEMELLAVVGIDLDVTLEEAIDRRSPGFLQTFCNANGSVLERKAGSPAFGMYLVLVWVFLLQPEDRLLHPSR